MKRKRSWTSNAAQRTRLVERDEGCKGRELWPHECWGPIEIHHVLPRGRGGKHGDDNLVAVCSWMHRWIHEHPITARDLGLLR